MEVPPPPDDGADYLLRLLARGIRPDRRRSIAEWAEAERVVSEGAYQGRWRNHRAPYLVEIMERASLQSPTRRVSFLKSAQLGGTQVGLNLAGQILSETPAEAMIVLPSLNSLRMYNRDKLDKMIQSTPALQRAVADITERSGQGSTVAVKRGARGAQVELVTASSSKDLQSRTIRVLILEEISEYDFDVGGRGDPVDQALARTIQWRKRGEKVVDISTPSIKGSCRITKLWEKGSRGRYLVPCPHCAHRQTLRFANLKWPKGEPAKAAYACESCGTLIEERLKARMLAEGSWVHEAPELLDVHASYAINTLYSDFTPWRAFAEMSEAADADPSKRKTFWQQWLGEAWDEAFDLPKAEVLMLRRDAWTPGRVPPGVLFVVGATDVQGDRLEWTVWGFDRNFGQWRIAGGTLAGDPTHPEVWREHDAVLARSWRDAWGREVRPRSWGIDAGYLSGTVYAYVLRQTGRHAFQVMALDGRDGWRLPPIGKEVWKRVRIPGQDHLPDEARPKCPLYPVGTWDLKSEIASALRLTEEGPGPEGWPAGALRFNEEVDKAWLEELLAERFIEDPRTGKRSWAKVQARNEAWDIAVYCRAQARALTLTMTVQNWDALIVETQGPPAEAQADLLNLITPSLKAQAESAAAARIAEADRLAVQAAANPPRRIAEERFFDGAEDFWS